MNRNYKFAVYALIILILLLAAAGAIIYFGFSKFNLGFDDARRLSEMEYEQVFSDNEFSGYFSDEQKSIDVKNYKINISLFPDEEKIEAETEISGIYKGGGLNRFPLNFYDNFTIDSALFNNKKAEYSFKNKKIFINRKISRNDSFDILISYSGRPVSKGFGSFVWGGYKNSSVVYTMNEPVYASTWFPCNDLPDDKALLNISIENDTGFVSLSNGKLISSTVIGGRKIYNYKTYYPISTYLIAIYSAKYGRAASKVIIDRDTLDLEYYFLPGKKEAALKDFKLHPKILKFFSDKFGGYPFIKEKYGIAEFLWKRGAMESQTIVGIGDNFVGGYGFIDDMIIHEAAHHWWGDAVGPKTWKDIWLNEGFATYSEALFYENQSGKNARISTMLSKKGEFGESPLYNPSTGLFSSLVYNKGAWVLNMLRFELGNKIFFKILRSYFEKYKYSNASTEDFKNICEKISNRNLDKFFEQWVFDGVGMLKIQYSADTKQEGTKFINLIHIKQIQDGYKNYFFPLQIEAKTGEKKSFPHNFYINSIDTVLEIKTESRPDTIIMDPDYRLYAEFSEIRFK